MPTNFLSQQIQTVKLDFMWDRYLPVMTKLVSHSASKQLAKFLCSLPCLTTITMEGNLYLSDDLITELSSLAAFSQIQTVNLDFRTNFDKAVKELSHSASNQLANFICSLPCLTTLEIKGNEYLPDAFFTELASLAASPQNPYFKEKKQISLLQAWSARKDLQQKQQLMMISTHQKPSNLDMPSTSGTRSTQRRTGAGLYTRILIFFI
ncbi:uncharacterized protein LOC115918204 [Strongylocentrotus purpuratus]|uniref:Uncharacterized protein n=1 Tax=Strongylocentrotus purpuratus TaxID=7668 RepID=A0A7M7STU2_STRPU|nr:uncharacterized protein LOC115918204 [Strongylocentrotus purpuratus]